MKLLSTPFSPFSRKVLVLAHEKGVRDRIDTVLTEVGTHVPLRTDVHDRLSHTAPLMKIPVLIDGSQSLFDSRVICEYLDGLFVDPRMFPDIGPARWDALRQQALADGIMDAAILCRFEQVRSPQPWRDWHEAQTRRIYQAADALNVAAATFGDHPTIGLISAACALGYLDFRLADLDWRRQRSALADWFKHFKERPSMRMTDPQAA
jgi:glutathione S-transferase